MNFNNIKKNFTFFKFYLKVSFIVILIKEILIKIYNNIRKIKQYYILLKWVFDIIRFESNTNIILNNIL